MPAGEVSHRPPGRLEGPCSPRHEALLAGAWKDLASLHRAALIRDHRRPRTASAWRPRALARRAALRWFGSFDSLCRRTPGGRGSQKWLRGPLPFGRGTASGTSSVATAARRAAARRCWRWWFEVGIVQSSVDESRASAGRVPCLCGKWQIYLFDHIRGLEPRPWHSSLLFLFVAVFTRFRWLVARTQDCVTDSLCATVVTSALRRGG